MNHEPVLRYVRIMPDDVVTMLADSQKLSDVDLSVIKAFIEEQKPLGDICFTKLPSDLYEKATEAMTVIVMEHMDFLSKNARTSLETCFEHCASHYRKEFGKGHTYMDLWSVALIEESMDMFSYFATQVFQREAAKTMVCEKLDNMFDQYEEEFKGKGKASARH